MKRTISLLLVLVLVLSMAPMPVHAVDTPDHNHSYSDGIETPDTGVSDDGQSAPAEPIAPVPEGGMDVIEQIINGVYHYAGRCGDDLTWTLNRETQTLTVSGTGAMWDFQALGSPWYPYRSMIRHVVLEQGVTGIGKNAFAYHCSIDNQTYPSDIKLPDSVVFVDSSAFLSSEFSMDIYTSDLVRWCSTSRSFLGYVPQTRLYLNGEPVEDLVIPEEVTQIKASAFRGIKLRSVTIPDHVTAIGDEAFYDTAIESLTISNRVTSIGARAFFNTNIKEVTLPDGLLTIGDGAFSYAAIQSLTIPNGVTSIGAKAFAYTGIQEVTIPDSVRTIGDEAFLGSALTRVRFGSGVTELGNGVFADCTDLGEVTLHKELTAIVDKMFFGCTSLTAIQLPDAVKRIGAEAFAESGLEAFTIGPRVSVIGDGAFAHCAKLTELTIPANVQTLGDGVFAGTGITHIVIGSGVTSLSRGTFSGCSQVTAITIPDSVTTVGETPFSDCDALQTVKLGRGITVIDRTMFQSCENLVSVSIPDTVTTIDAYAFLDCHKLTYTEYEGIFYLGNEENPYVYLDRVEDKSISALTIHPDTRVIKDSAFSGCNKLVSLQIPDKVVTIGHYAFSECSTLSQVTLGQSLQTIGKGAFYGNYYLSEVIIPDGVTEIGDNAFGSCVRLTDVTIPASVTVIGENAFSDCRTLQKITVDAGNSAYCRDENGLLYSKDKRRLLWVPAQLATDLVIHANVTVIDSGALTDCTLLTSITIPAGVTALDKNLLDDCAALERIMVDQNNRAYSSDSYGILYNKDKTLLIMAPHMLVGAVTLPASVTTIGNKAFYSCERVTSITIPEGVTTIESYAFAYCRGLSAIQIPDSVKQIGASAFYTCTALKSVQLGCGITRIEADTFRRCPCLTQVRIPEGVTFIGDYAFSSCVALQAVWIPQSVEQFGRGVFSDTPMLWHILYRGACHQWDEIIVLDDNEQLSTVIIHGLCNGDDLIDVENQSCSVCNGHDHQYVATGDSATCTNAGYVITQCARCGNTVEDRKQPVSAYHIWNETCTTARSCTRCGTSVGAPAAPGHDWQNATCTENGFCRRCRTVWTAEGHKWDALDCTVAKTCTVCGVTRAPEAHQFNPSGGSNCAKCNGDGSDGSPGLQLTHRYSFTWGEADPGWKDYYVVSGWGTCTDTDVVIPSTYRGWPVRGIEEGAFTKSYGDQPIMTSVTIPDTIYYIGAGAFASCPDLTAVHIEDMDAWCRIQFENAASNPLYFAGTLCLNGEPVTDLVVPEGVCSLTYTFTNCTSLERVTLPASMRVLGRGYEFDNEFLGDFQGCTNLKEVQLSEGLVLINHSAFYDCTSLEQIRIPDSVLAIGSYVFNNCASLKAVTLPKNLIQIADGAFSECVALEEIHIPAGVTAIGKRAFYGCLGLSELTVPGSVGSIGEYAFYNCDNLQRVEIGEGVKTICDSAFGSCDSLWQLRIPASVTSIGEAAFMHSANLDTIRFGGTIAQWEAVEKGAYWEPDYTYAVFCEMECTVNGHRWIDATCTAPKICDYCGQIGREPLGHDFANGFCRRCGELNNPSMGLEYSIAFGECTVIGVGTCTDTVLRIPNYHEGLPVTRIGTTAFDGNTQLREVVMGGHMEFVMDRAFANCSALTKVHIGENVTFIRGSAFEGCPALEEVWLGNKLESIGGRAFYGCESLKAITIPDSVKQIEGAAFSGCTGLETVDLGSGVESIGSSAFQECDALQKIDIPDSVTYIGMYAFAYCDFLTDVAIGKGNPTIGDGAFALCNALTNVTIDSGSIGPSAFSSCANLKRLELGLAVTKIGSDGFSRCGNELAIYYAGSKAQWGEVVLESNWSYFTDYVLYYRGECTSGDHDWVAATCTAAKYCRICGTAEGQALGHSWTEASCTDPQTCSRCGITQGQALGHGWLEATCLAPETCAVCGQTRGNALGHRYTDVYIEPTCTEEGENCRKCTRCGDKVNSYPIAALGHKWMEAYCADTEKCSRCGADSGNPGYLHNWIPANCTDPKTCRDCGETYDFPLGHNWQKATCTTPDTCLRCGQTRGSVLGHFYENGLCTRCGCGITDSQGLAFTLEGDHYIVSGIGSCPDLWIVIPDTYEGLPVTGIADDAFKENKAIRGVTIPEGVKQIGKSAFYWCYMLQRVDFPDSLASIGDYAFYRCSRLERVDLGGITAIGAYAFYDCSAMTALTLGDRPVNFGSYAFAGCSKLKSVVIPNGVTQISDSVFESCSALMSVTIPASVTTVKYSAFRDCRALWHVLYQGTQEQWDAIAISSANDPLLSAVRHNECTGDEITDLDGQQCSLCGCAHSYTFVITAPTCTEQGYTTYTCSRCGDSYADDYVDALGHDLVHHNGKTPGCTEIGWTAYDTCNRCDYTTYTELEPAGHSYQKVTTAPTCTEQGYTTYTCACGHSQIKDYVPALKHDFGFWYPVTAPTCTQAGLEQRDCGRCDHTETRATDPTGHSYSQKVTAPTCTEPGYTTYTCACGEQYRGDETLPLGHSEKQVAKADPTCTEGGYIDYECSRCGGNDRRELLPAAGHQWTDPTCTEAGYCSVCSMLRPDSAALGHSHQPAEVILPDCWSGGYTVYRCIRCPDSYQGDHTPRRGHLWQDATCTEPETCSDCGITDGEALGHLFAGGRCSRCGAMPTASEGLAFTQEGDHYVLSGIGTCADTLIVIPQTHAGLPVTGIAYGAFANNSAITGVIIPDTVTDIGSGAFANCGALRLADLGNGVKQLGASCFYSCYVLETVKIPDSVDVIGNSAFRYCSSLKELDLGNGVTQIGNSAFETCMLQGSLVIPDSVEHIGDYAFRANGKLQSVTLGQSVTVLGKGAFDLCRQLISVTIPAGLTQIGQNAFSGCDALWHVLHMGTQAQWEAIVLGSGNSCLTNAIRHHECTGDEITDLAGQQCGICNCAHTYGQVTTPPTCTEQGYTTYTCSRCGECYVDDYTDALGHEYGPWYAVSEPTCTEPGVSGADCTRCGHHTEKAVDANGHSYGEEVSPPSCTEQGYTVFTCHCGNSYIDSYVAALGHKDLNSDHACDNGCDVYQGVHADGDDKDHLCDHGCGATLTGHSHQAVVTPPTCADRGYTTHTCRCGDCYVDSYVNALGHSFTRYISDNNATTEADGTKTATCDRGCGQRHTVIDEGSKLTVSEITSETFEISGDYIGNIGTGTTVQQLLDGIGEASYVKVFRDGVEITGTETLGTGMEVRLIVNGQVMQTLQVVVVGDTNGDGNINITDLLAAKAHLLEKSQLSGAAAQAADTNQDGNVNITDFLQIKAHILGKSTITPN